MDGRLGMALDARCWSAMIDTISVAAGTLDLAMRPIQRENLCVVKIRHAIDPVMAIQASIAELVNMSAHVRCPGVITGGMTIGTSLMIHLRQLGYVAA
jgi:hypothetical protein